jgi:hypothetical protein
MVSTFSSAKDFGAGANTMFLVRNRKKFRGGSVTEQKTGRFVDGPKQSDVIPQDGVIPQDDVIPQEGLGIFSCFENLNMKMPSTFMKNVQNCVDL